MRNERFCKHARAINNTLAKIDRMFEVICKQPLELVLIQFLDVIWIAGAWLIRKVIFIRAGNNQNTIRAQNTLEFLHHLFVLIVMLYGLKTNHHINTCIKQRNLRTASDQVFEILLFIAFASVLNGLK